MKKARALRMVVLASGGGTNLQAIINQIKTRQINATIAAVISDNPDAFSLERAAAAGITTHHIKFDRSNRARFDRQLEKLLLTINPDLIVLAGYMRILCASTVASFQGRILNVHPSLLPAYPGLDTYRRVMVAGDHWHGTTVHFVTPELDAGPAIVQYRIKIQPGDTEPELRARVQQGEYRVYPLAIKWFCAGRLLFRQGKVFFDQQPLRQPLIVYEPC